MEIAKQELIVHAREATSRVLSELSGECRPRPLLSVLGPLLDPSLLIRLSPSLEDRQMSEQIALDTRKREQFQRLKEQFVKDQEVGGVGSGWFWLLESLIWQMRLCVLCSDAWQPDKKS